MYSIFWNFYRDTNMNMKKTVFFLLLGTLIACSGGKNKPGTDTKQPRDIIQEIQNRDITNDKEVQVIIDDIHPSEIPKGDMGEEIREVTDTVDVKDNGKEDAKEVIETPDNMELPLQDIAKDDVEEEKEIEQDVPGDTAADVADVANDSGVINIDFMTGDASDADTDADVHTGDIVEDVLMDGDLTSEDSTTGEVSQEDTSGRDADVQDGEFLANDTRQDAQNDTVTFVCVAAKGSTDLTLIRGTVVTGDTVIRHGEVLFSASTHKILCVDQWGRCQATAGEDPTIICANGMIYPGLVDSHNHNQYNFMPRWKHSGLFQDRYQWQKTASYKRFKHSYDAIKGDHICAMMRYAEVRELMAGTTATIGSVGGDCIDGLVRNLEEGAQANGINESGIKYTSGNISSFKSSYISSTVKGLKDGSIEAFLVHLAEGVDQLSFGEWAKLKADDLLQAGTAIIHGTALRTTQFVQMLGTGAKLIWSPRSNIDLYGQTTPAIIAIHLGLVVALAPDWVPSGSLNMLDAMKCADHVDNLFLGDQLTPKELFKMVTIRPAQACHVEDRLGLLKSGYYADVLVISGDSDKPYQALLDAEPGDVRAVFIGGGFVYGDTDVWDEFAGREPYDWCEDTTVCGNAKKLCVKRSAVVTAPTGKTFAQVKDELIQALTTARHADSAWDPNNLDATYEYGLSPLFNCATGEAAAPCVLGNVQYPWTPKDGDLDGDGVPDATDNCPDVYNPRQWDTDSDGVGDMCDKCPVVPGEDCKPGTPDDPDQDGVSVANDNCPFTYNPGQEDQDNDGKGDACDACPTQPNPGDEPCTFTIRQVRDPNTPPQVNYGTRVKFSGPIVTAITPDTSKYKGFYIQDPNSTDFSGMYVFVGTSMPQGIAVGNAVSVAGTLVDFYGMDEVKDPTYSVVNATPDQQITPLVVDPADVADNGSRAEALEGVLIEVDNVTVVKANPDAPKDYNECELTGGLRMDDALFDYTKLGIRTQGQCLKKVVGILVYSFGHYKILPRSASDITVCQGADQ